MRLVWLLLVVPVAVALSLTAVGSVLPEQLEVVRDARYERPVEAVWEVLVAVEDAAAWRDDLQAVERLPDQDGRRVWREVSRRGDRLRLEAVEEEAPRRLVVRIAEPDLPFGGTWTYQLEPDGEGTRLRITERGEIYNAVFRVLARVMSGQTKPLDRYLEALGRHLEAPAGAVTDRPASPR